MQFEDEKKELNKKLAIINKQYEEVAAKSGYVGDDISEIALDESRKRMLESLISAKKDPYFARLDFKEEEADEVKVTYIGKAGVFDEKNGNVIITDWRAPISSLFYGFSGSEEDVYYQSPDGIVEGEIYLKRNIVTYEQELQRVVDRYIRGEQELSGGDEFLLYKLGDQKDNRLRDIVATIQGEQNEIIRYPLNQAVIIQGVAGSGKTTVALHRLAYLLYEYREQLNANRMIIFAPNTIFLDYISQVLPELGVGDIVQTTFPKWAMTIIDDPNCHLESLSKRRKAFFESERVDQGNLKGTLAFQQKIREQLSQLEKEWLPAEDFIPWENKQGVSLEKIKSWLETDFKDNPVVKKYERLKAKLTRWIEIEAKMYEEKKEQAQARKEGKTQLRKYLRKWKNRKPYELYAQILKRMGKEDILPPKKNIALDDLAPLLDIHDYWFGIEKEDRFDHVVIDEAQDFSPYQVSVLNARTKKASFTILGDLAQGIHRDEGIDQWERFIELFGTSRAKFFQMTKSYRSTYEIIAFSNKILSHLENPPAYAEPVFRSGEDVQIQQIQAEDKTKKIVSWVNAMEHQGMNTIAVILRSESACDQVYANLKSELPALKMITSEDKTYEGGLSLLPVYVSKGLEFDAVLMVDVDEVHYPKHEQTTKLLYVGCTRALHHLSIFYSGKPSELISLG
ncbi:UvrD-helicase domain-containing protein [Lederbergia sp. NSJ-179]|uniref:HelD family protein n=1 Tax=Lederbergia sp. NSJ-179 TaxID=2931402 RepID=UPI001FD00A32|nr:3'-5' exonuclease [Lederbergia sp. NSJ-179]MCJ7841906.1 UvrD-helicase domain-containing protein [Lederbergia sp. NSJ-179]